jgi:hypothetical protein
VPVRQIGRFTGLVGPAATSSEVELWLTEIGFEDISITVSGAIGYFRAVKG